MFGRKVHNYEEDDLQEEHELLEDGSILYTQGDRAGLLFHYYSDEELNDAFLNYNVLKMESDRRGNRHLIIRFGE